MEENVGVLGQMKLFFGFTCFGFLKKKKNRKNRRKPYQQTLTNTNTIPPNLNQLAIANGQKVLLNSIL